MDNDLYTVTLQFDARNDGMRASVQNCLAQIKGVSPERLASLPGNGRLIVQRNADPKLAQRLKKALDATGAQCRLVRQSPQPAAEQVATLKGRRPPLAGQTEPTTVTCPQCGFTQPALPECRACGIIFAKARPRGAIPTGPVEANPLKEEPLLTQDLVSPWERLRRQILPSVWAWLRGQTCGKDDLRRWSQKLGDALGRCALVFCLTLILETGLLFMSRLMWFVYTHTPVGEYYLTRMGEEAEAIQNLMQMEIWLLTWRTTLLALLVCLATGAIVRVAHLMRYFYEPLGMVGKIFLWCLPLIAGVGWLASQQEPWPPYAVACMLMAVPTACLLSTCFNLAEVLLPELGEVFNRGFRMLPGAHDTLFGLKDKLRQWRDELRRNE